VLPIGTGTQLSVDIHPESTMVTHDAESFSNVDDNGVLTHVGFWKLVSHLQVRCLLKGLNRTWRRIRNLMTLRSLMLVAGLCP
jgi:hypothetical protein